MSTFTLGHTRIMGTGVYIPERRVTSVELMKEIDSKGRFGVPYQWIDRTIGIRERRVAPDDITFAEMAATAAREALAEAGVRPKDIGAILYCGIDRDYLEPATAHLVQEQVGVENAICFDLTNACHGFMNGIHVVDALVATGQIRHALVVTAERNFRITKEAIKALQATTDREVFVNLVGGLTVGDAGAAMVVGPKTFEEEGFVGFMLQSRGEFNDLCVFKNRDQENAATGHMVMTRIVREHLRLHADMYPDFMRRLHWSPEQIAKFVHHQVGRKAFKMHAAYSHVPLQAMPDTVSWLGNIASATIPVNLHYLRREGAVRPREKVFISAAGSGLSISQAGLVWDEAA